MNKQDIPVVTTVYNNYLYLDNFIAQCQEHGLNNLIVINSNSTSPATLTYLADNKSKFQLITLEDNLGPRYVIHSNRMATLLPSKFILSDPDIELNPVMPKNFLGIFNEVSENYKVAKVGLALSLFEDKINQNLEIAFKDYSTTLKQWESQFWQIKLGKTLDANPIYQASVDTTFCFFNRDYFDPNNEIKGVRIGGDYTCTHLPWLKNNPIHLDSDEADSYIFSSMQSTSSRNSPEILNQNLYIAYLKIQIENLNIQVQDLASRLQSTYNSKSWLITKPLRKFLSLFR